MEDFVQQKGITLIEMLVVLMIVAMVLVMATPMYDHHRARIDAETSMAQLQTAIQMARLSALSYGVPVTLCPSQDKEHCQGDWSQGLMVFTDPEQAHQMTKESHVLRVFQLNLPRAQLSLRAFPESHYVTFLPRGYNHRQNGTFYYTDRQVGIYQRLIINRMGRVRLANDK